MDEAVGRPMVRTPQANHVRWTTRTVKLLEFTVFALQEVFCTNIARSELATFTFPHSRTIEMRSVGVWDLLVDKLFGFLRDQMPKHTTEALQDKATDQGEREAQSSLCSSSLPTFTGCSS